MMFVPARASKSGSRSGSFTALVATVILPFFTGSSAAFAENLFLRGDVNANDRIEVTDSVLISIGDFSNPHSTQEDSCSRKANAFEHPYAATRSRNDRYLRNRDLCAQVDLDRITSRLR